MTILGKHTIAELRDLIKAMSYEVKQIQEGYAAVEADWWTVDSAKAQAWAIDWEAFKTRFKTALSAADIRFAIASNMLGVRDSVIPAEEAYQGVLRAVTVQTDGSFAPTDMAGLHNRLIEVRRTMGKADISFADMPQPGADTDADLAAFVQTDLALRNLEATAKKAGSAVASSPTTYLVLAGAAGLGLTALYVVSRR